MSQLRLATRGSRQARTQAEWVGSLLAEHGHECELVIVETHGDRTQDANVPLHSIGGQGVFTKEVQRAVLDGRADIAVHSAKDLPTASVDGLTIAACAPRRNASDALIGRRLDDLAPGATIATGSVRRRAQLADRRPDLTFTELRGNIDRRLAKIPTDGAIVMAVAALEVLDITDVDAHHLDLATMVPAVGQGCVALECHTDADRVAATLADIDDAATRWSVSVERAYLAELGSGCSLPIGAHVRDRTLHTYLAGDADTIRDQIALSGRLDSDLSTAAAAARQHLEQVGGKIAP